MPFPGDDPRSFDDCLRSAAERRNLQRQRAERRRRVLRSAILALGFLACALVALLFMSCAAHAAEVSWRKPLLAYGAGGAADAITYARVYGQPGTQELGPLARHLDPAGVAVLKGAQVFALSGIDVWLQKTSPGKARWFRRAATAALFGSAVANVVADRRARGRR